MREMGLSHAYTRRSPKPAGGGTRVARGYKLVMMVGALLSLLLGEPTMRRSAAQPIEIPDSWGGPLAARPRLTGDWGGFRDDLGRKGVVLDVDVIATPQGVTTGGRDTGGGFWGNAEYTLNVDTGKAGLWPGGFLKVVGNTGFGDHVLGDSGAIVPVNTGALIPTQKEDTSALLHATFMQFLSPKFGLVAGKLFTLDAPGLFTGNYRTQFQNTALVVPAAAALIPISAYGGGIVVLPWDGVMLTALTLDPSGTPTDDDLGDVFDDGVTEVGTANVEIAPFGLRGHQTAGFMWSNKSRLSLLQDPSNLGRLLLQERFPRLADPGPILERILAARFPGLSNSTRPLNREDDSWTVFYAFDQYLWQPAGDPDRGIGVFFSVGVSDGQANPVRTSYMLGLGGNGVVPGRPDDTFGVGWAATDFSRHFVPLLRKRLDIGLEREDVVEFYYNVALAPWAQLTLDLQVVDPGLGKALGAGTQLTNVDTAVVVGSRLYLRF